MTRRQWFARMAGAVAAAIGPIGAAPSLTRIVQRFAAPATPRVDYTSWWREGIPAVPRTARYFMEYRNPRAGGWLGWFEDGAGRVLGWVNLRGETALAQAADRVGWTGLRAADRAWFTERARTALAVGDHVPIRATE